jgi:hypothetical protein
MEAFEEAGFDAKGKYVEKYYDVEKNKWLPKEPK